MTQDAFACQSANLPQFLQEVPGPRPEPADLSQRVHPDVRTGQRGRREHQHLLGKHRQRLPAMVPGRPRRYGQRRPDRDGPAARHLLGHPSASQPFACPTKGTAMMFPCTRRAIGGVVASTASPAWSAPGDQRPAMMASWPASSRGPGWSGLPAAGPARASSPASLRRHIRSPAGTARPSGRSPRSRPVPA